MLQGWNLYDIRRFGTGYNLANSARWSLLKKREIDPKECSHLLPISCHSVTWAALPANHSHLLTSGLRSEWRAKTNLFVTAAPVCAIAILVIENRLTHKSWDWVLMMSPVTSIWKCGNGFGTGIWVWVMGIWRRKSEKANYAIKRASWKILGRAQKMRRGKAYRGSKLRTMS